MAQYIQIVIKVSAKAKKDLKKIKSDWEDLKQSEEFKSGHDELTRRSFNTFIGTIAKPNK